MPPSPRRHRRTNARPVPPIAPPLFLLLLLCKRGCHPFEVRPSAPVTVVGGRGRPAAPPSFGPRPRPPAPEGAAVAALLKGDWGGVYDRGMTGDVPRWQGPGASFAPRVVGGDGDESVGGEHPSGRRTTPITRRSVLGRSAAVTAAVAFPAAAVFLTGIGGFVASAGAISLPRGSSSDARCTDLESCREIDEARDERDLRNNPVTRLPSGVKYKVLRPGVGATAVVGEDSTVDLIYSISQASGRYMYSRGFGYEKVRSEWDDGGGFGATRSDLGSDSLRLELGKRDGADRDVPLGIEQALVGMRVGERRRVVLPPGVGFETSGWRPEPTTRMGKAQIVAYKRLLEGLGSNQPPFPAPTLWDVEVVRIRK